MHRNVALRIGPVLVLAGLAGFLLGSCAGGDGSALTTATDRTRPGVTATRPAETRTETAIVTETRSVPIFPTATTPTTTTTDTSSTGAAWALVLLGLALAAALLVGGLLWRRRRDGASSWSGQLSDLSRRSLVALDDVLAEGSVVTGRVQALSSEARSLESRAPDDRSRASAARLRARLDDLAGTLETDRALRLGSPPPSPEQLSYSRALINQQAAELQGVLRPPPRSGPAPA